MRSRAIVRRGDDVRTDEGQKKQGDRQKERGGCDEQMKHFTLH